MATAPLPVIDFHTHYLGPALSPARTDGLPAALREHWNAINAKLADENALLADIRSDDLTGRVINAPTSLLSNPAEAIAPSSIARINDAIAALTERHRGKLFGLATIDAFSGDTGARELTRAVKELGLKGGFVESAQGEFLLDAPQARPTLEIAADLGVPLFVHPINPEHLTRQLSGYGTRQQISLLLLFLEDFFIRRDQPPFSSGNALGPARFIDISDHAANRRPARCGFSAIHRSVSASARPTASTAADARLQPPCEARTPIGSE